MEKKEARNKKKVGCQSLEEKRRKGEKEEKVRGEEAVERKKRRRQGEKEEKERRGKRKDRIMEEGYTKEVQKNKTSTAR